MNLETSTTLDWYVYVGRDSRLFFTANLRRTRPLRGGGRTRRNKKESTKNKRTHKVEGEQEEKGTRVWSHMTMYDEGMMDEGAASLRDRDMIAGKRGGPSVHPNVSLSFTRG